MSTTISFRFLDLPPEIREKVYILLSTNSQQPTSLSTAGVHINYPINLLLTSHQMYAESRFVYFTSNRFSLTLTRHTSTLGTFLSPCFSDARRLLQSLEINIVRWGKGNWFLAVFLPVVEDCVMYGRLRQLSMKVKRERGEGMPKGEPALALKRVLEDPYLEKVSLEIYWFDGKGREVIRDWTRNLDRGVKKELGIVREWNT